MGYRKRLLSLAAAVVLVGALPGAAAANTTEAIADTGGMSLTLPGVPIALEVVLDQFGNIDSVSFDTSFTQDHDAAHKVTFTSTADGSTVVKVKAEGSELTAKVKTSNLTDLVGAHTWSGDIFGSGETTTVGYTLAIVGSGDGAYLEIVPGSVMVTTSLPYTVDGPYTETDDDDEQEYESKVKIQFTDAGYTKSLKIEVETEYDNDDDHGYEGAHAKLKIELKGKDRQESMGAEAVGPQTWTGLLCDGSNVSVSYTVGADGSLTLNGVSADSGVTWTIDDDDDKDHEDELEIHFTDSKGDDDAELKIEVDLEHGELELKVKSKTTEKCDDDDHKDDDHKDDKTTRTTTTKTTRTTTTKTTRTTTTKTTRTTTTKTTRTTTTMTTMTTTDSASSGVRPSSRRAALIAIAVAGLMGLAACSPGSLDTPAEVVETSTTSTSSTQVTLAEGESTGTIDVSNLLSNALALYGDGYQFASVADVKGSEAAEITGAVVGLDAKMTVSSGDATVSYIITSEGSWVQTEGEEWQEVDSVGAIEQPLADLATPTSIAIVSTGDEGTTALAVYSGAAFNSEDDIQMALEFLDGWLVSASYRTDEASVSTTFSPLDGATVEPPSAAG